jgi:hypothetical protein
MLKAGRTGKRVPISRHVGVSPWALSGPVWTATPAGVSCALTVSQFDSATGGLYYRGANRLP